MKKKRGLSNSLASDPVAIYQASRGAMMATRRIRIILRIPSLLAKPKKKVPGKDLPLSQQQ
jgi:hypothetical protein